MSDEQYMRLAIEEAKKSIEPGKCGAVIVKGGEIIAKTYNSQRRDHHVTAHAETKAITEAGKKTGNKKLEGCTVYATCEPCKICLSAMVFARIGKLVYGVSIKDMFDSFIDIDIDTFLSKSPYKFEVVKNFMEDECRGIYGVFAYHYACCVISKFNIAKKAVF